VGYHLPARAPEPTVPAIFASRTAGGRKVPELGCADIVVLIYLLFEIALCAFFFRMLIWLLRLLGLCVIAGSRQALFVEGSR